MAAAHDGDGAAHEQLWALIYDELHRMARRQLASEAHGRRPQPTSLIHEVYLRLAGGQDEQWKHKGHFFAAAAEAMRRIRVEYARKRGSLKRGGDRGAEPLLDDPASFDRDGAEVLAVDEALTKLEEQFPEKAKVVTLRYFGGLTVDESAAALGIAPRTVDKYWAFARAWLHRELSPE